MTNSNIAPTYASITADLSALLNPPSFIALLGLATSAAVRAIQSGLQSDINSSEKALYAAENALYYGTEQRGDASTAAAENALIQIGFMLDALPEMQHV